MLLMIFLKFLANSFLKKFNILIIYRFGSSLGDQLCLTAIVKRLNINDVKIFLFTNHSYLFRNNPNFYLIINCKNYFIRKILGKLFKILECDSILEYKFKISHESKDKYFISNLNKPYHLANIHALHFNRYLQKEDNNLNCDFFFDNKEIINFEKNFQFKKKFAIVHSETKLSFTPNKNWYPDRFNKIIKNLNFVDWIQIGSKKDYKILNTFDMRDNDIREMAYILSRCEFVLCLEGFINHLSSCFEKKTFVIKSGFVPNSTVSYKNSYFIKAKEKPSCDPCYLLTKCPINDYPCMNDISSEDVINFIRNELDKKIV
jgi:ADP-heptose:LPS heptosyltransferase